MPALLAAVALALGIRQPATFFLKDGDRVVFYGDSITDNGTYGRYIETFVLTRMPGLRISWINAGWSGDRVGGGGGGAVDLRLDRDVVSRKPTVVTIMLGMNDGNVRPFEQGAYDTYKNGLEHIVQKLRADLPGVRLVLFKPSPYDDVNFAPGFPGGYNSTLVKFGDAVAELGERESIPVIDLNAPLQNILVRAKAYDPEVSKRLIPDRIHPEPAGHLAMAYSILKGWSAPSLVSNLELDCSRKAVVARDKTWVRDLDFGRDISWVQTDECLPFPIEFKNPRVALVIRSGGVMTDLNRQGLRVRGLTAPEYRLTIDDDEIAVFSKQQLEDGVELTGYDTPMVKQAWTVALMTQQRAALRYAQWRTIEIGLKDVPGVQRDNALRAIDALEQDVIRRQRELAKPQPRRYRLTPVG